jgi:short-subunit dehydrogenase
VKNGKVIFVTGATSGIGRMITEMCVKLGHKVYATGRNEPSLEMLSKLGATVFKADLTKKEDIEYVCNHLPPIDVAIMNAGLGIFQNAFDLLDEEVETMLDVNVRAPMLLTRRLAHSMIERKSGHIIFIGSQAGKVDTRKASVYAASKHAITGFANGLRMELEPYHVKVTAIYPGPIDTPFLQKADATNAYRDTIRSFLLKPEKVAASVVQCINHPVREVNLPKILGITSKLYAIAPRLVERVGRSFFNKK